MKKHIKGNEKNKQFVRGPQMPVSECQYGRGTAGPGAGAFLH